MFGNYASFLMLFCLGFDSEINAGLQDQYYRQYAGCYKDAAGDRMQFDLMSHDNLTIQDCITTCQRQRTTFAGIQNGSNCKCTNVFKNSQSHEICNSPCSGNPRQACGGEKAFAVYMVCRPGMYSYECSQHCNCISGAPCYFESGYCPNGKIHPIGNTTESTYENLTNVNLTLNQTADQSSTFIDNIAYSASFAVDGDTNPYHPHCAHGADNSSGPNWFYVDLGRPYHVQYVVLTNRDCSPHDCANRLNHFHVRISDTPPSQHPPVKGSEPNCGKYPNQTLDGGRLTVHCQANTPPSRYVIIQQPLNGFGYLTICEIEVYAADVCPNGTYGIDCNRRCHCANDEGCSSNGICLNGCRRGWTGSNCDMLDQEGCRENEDDCELVETCQIINLLSANVSRCECKTGFYRETIWSHCSDADHVFGIILIMSTAASISIVLLTFVIFVVRVSIQSTRRVIISSAKSVLETESVQISNGNNYLLATNDSYNKIDESISNRNTGGLALADLQDRLTNHAEILKKEFDDIPMQTQASCSYGKQTHLKSKNHFQNIIPYDENRVVLNNSDEQDSSDYINASYVTGFNAEKMVATQGPTENTVNDFWRMVFQLEARVIVMLCRQEDSGKANCKQYWPMSESEVYGNVTVTLLKQISWPHFQCRYLTATKNNSELLDIVHWQFTSWPDHGVPDNVRTILSFRRKVRQSMKKDRYTVIHCSAGVARTGTFLAIDYLMQEARLEGKVDVAGCVRRMRGERPRMIPTLEKYEFIYRTLAAHISTGKTACSATKFNAYYGRLQKLVDGKSNLEHQFNILLKEAESLLNKDSNRKKSGSEHETLSPALVPSITSKGSYIIDEISKPICAEDYWSNLPDSCITFVLIDCDKSLEQVFPTEEQPLNFDSSPIFLKNKIAKLYGCCYKVGVSNPTEQDTTYENETSGIYTNECNDDYAREITVLHVTLSVTDVFALDVVKCLYSDFTDVMENNRIISIQYNSHLSSGPSLAGFITAAWNAIEMVENYGEVEIFQISQEVLMKTKNTAVLDLITFKELHNVVLEFITTQKMTPQ